jgi:hypothetical protein
VDADDIRRADLDFMVERGHAVVPRAPDPAGRPHDPVHRQRDAALLPYLNGADHPAGRRLTDSQTCRRAQDIEEVGDNRHTTFFVMRTEEHAAGRQPGSADRDPQQEDWWVPGSSAKAMPVGEPGGRTPRSSTSARRSNTISRRGRLPPEL